MRERNGRGARQGTGPAGAGANFERIYRTTVPRRSSPRRWRTTSAREFEAQVFRTSEDCTVMQARKESLWRHLLGVSYAITVVFTSGEGQLSIGLGATNGSTQR